MEPLRCREGTKPELSEIANFLPTFHGLSPDEFDAHWYRKTEHEVVQHLFTVAASLDSLVLGETQIIGQVRDAYETARALGSAGPQLHPLFQRAVAIGKQVMNQTALGAGRLSIASAAVDYARSIFDHFHDKTVLCIGAGKMARLAISHFNALHPGRLLICNRDPAKATALAAEYNGEAVPFEQLTDHLAHADVVITSTGSSLPIITRSMFESVLKQRRYRPIFLVDIAVPRDVEESVGQLDHVYLYNIDDIQQVVSSSQYHLNAVIESARALVQSAVNEFAAWQRTRELGPAIEQLYARYHTLAQEELSRLTNRLPNLTASERQELEEMIRRIVNKLLHDPIQTLKNADDQHASASQYLHAMNKLFHLDERWKSFLNRLSIRAWPPDRRLAFLVFFVCFFAYAHTDLFDIFYHLLVDGCLLAVWIVAAWGTGRWIVRNGPSILVQVTRIAVGLGVLSIVILLLGLAGCFGDWLIAALIPLSRRDSCIIGVGRHCRPTPRTKKFRDNDSLRRWLQQLPLVPIGCSFYSPPSPLSLTTAGGLIMPG